MIIYRIFLCLVIGMAAWVGFSERTHREENLKTGPLKPGRKTPLFYPLMLPLFLGIIFVMALFTGSGLFSAMMTANVGVLFLIITAYYAVLLLLLPLFRKVISARACADLWLVPTILYFSFNMTAYESKPLLLITLSRQRLAIFAWLWLAGFVGVMLWQLISHFHYRRFLLKHAQPISDNRILSLWREASVRHGVKAKIKIPVLVSDCVSTPLSIGCFDRTMRLILPRESYTQQELSLIFQHELRHILRQDTQTKLFVGLCTAMCWFNPLAWIARKKASDDLELSCDEAVLSGTDEATRRLYAELLLKNAGSSPGYTTCLSASASSLRYRLRNIMKPAKRRSGGVVIGLALSLLIMSVGAVAFTDSVGTVQSFVFDKAPPGIKIDSISVLKSRDSLFDHSVYKWEEGPLTDYLASLRVKQLYGGNHRGQPGSQLYIDYSEIVGGEVVSLTRFSLHDGLLFVNIPYDNFGELVFVLEEEVDWDYLTSLLDFDAENPNPPPTPPEMMMDFGPSVSPDSELMYASKTVLSIRGAYAEQWGHQPPVDEEIGGVGGVSGFPVTWVKLYFSYEPRGEYRVTAENWDRTAISFVSSGKLEDDILPLAPYSAHYTVYATFTTVRDTTYDMKFVFDVELPSEEQEDTDDFVPGLWARKERTP